MRQRLKNKTTEKAGTSSKMRLKSTKKSDFPELKLASLLFGSDMDKDEWMNGIKVHARALSDNLLNNDIPRFEKYLDSGFGDFEVKPAVKKRIQQSGVMTMDQKSFLQEFLQLAVLIEHSTIPPYLTAMYSIKEGTNPIATNIIRSVVIEEMLHMIMVCNVLNAIDIIPSVNKPQNFPSYPMKLPLKVDFYVNLEKFSSNSIATFIAIESPDQPTVLAPSFQPEPEARLYSKKSVKEATDFWSSENLVELLTENVSTIGEFYDLLFFFLVIFQCVDFYKRTGKFPTSFDDINTGGLFTGDPSRQIGSEHYYGSGGTLIKVEDLRGVMHVFEEIKDQGEGAGDTIFADPNEFSEGVELAHYFRFKEIFHERFYIGGDYTPFTDKHGRMPVITPPTGRPLKVDWEAVYPMKANVKMSDYASNTALYAQGKAFNETYKKMLDAIQGAVEGNPEELSKSVMFMYALKEQAIELMRQPLTAQENAGPTFEYPTN